MAIVDFELLIRTDLLLFKGFLKSYRYSMYNWTLLWFLYADMIT